jgi:hypothetical protein
VRKLLLNEVRAAERVVDVIPADCREVCAPGIRSGAGSARMAGMSWPVHPMKYGRRSRPSNSISAER